MSSIIEGFMFAWNKNREYGPKLVADLTDDQMTTQPAPEGNAPSNHPAWVLSHLNVYLPVIAAIIKNEPFADPKEHPFGMLSKPESDRSIYSSKDELVSEFVKWHDEIAALLANADNSIFENQIKLERWQNIMPSASIALPYLMFNHENGHLGQVSAWRRIQGMPSV
ncbi:MAG: DinB family protein [Planctomycetota bacterium]